MSLNGIEKYTQPDGLIVPKITHNGPVTVDETGDGIKHFCMKHILKVRLGVSRPHDLEEFERVIASCFKAGYQGLMNRSPTKTGEQITKDAIIAVVYCAKVMKSNLGWVIMNRGNATRLGPLKWFYPNLFPELFDSIVPLKYLFQRTFWESWIGKNPEVITHIQICSLPPDKRPNYLRVIWTTGYFCTVKVEHSGLTTLNYIMAMAMYGQYALLDLAIDYWQSRVDKHWGSIKGALRDEYESGHPIYEEWV